MIPSWVAVVTGISLAILALAAIAIALSSVIAVLALRTFLRILEHLAGPAVSDVRQLVATIRTEAESLVGTSRELRGRIVKAADAAETRLADLDALFGVVQEEVETTALDVAATLRNVRRGLSVLEWGRRAIRCSRSGSCTCLIWRPTPWRTTFSCRASWSLRRAPRPWATATGRAGSRPTWVRPTRKRLRS